MVPAVLLAIFVALQFTPKWLQLAAQISAAVLVMAYTFQDYNWRGVLVAAGAMMLMRGIMMSLVYLVYLTLIVLQI